ncbi:MAG: phosphatidylserine decarboxylase [Deltaproteobacteria bacterium]|nr:phosphatidylserine decarboxylase [Deltaproteobacteria bacterium]
MASRLPNARRAFEPGRSISRYTRAVETEPVAADAFIRWFYTRFRRTFPRLARLAAGGLVSRVVAWFVFDAPWTRADAAGFIRANGIRLDDLREGEPQPTTRRQVFLRKIAYEAKRPMPADEAAAVSVADAKVVAGTLDDALPWPVKGAFFTLEKLFDIRAPWDESFRGGTWFVFRLAPPDYHWYHAPATGSVVDLYDIPGALFSVNPRAVRAIPSLLSGNARRVIVIDTDIKGGSGLGRVAVVPVGAQVIGSIVDAYCETGYDAPQPLRAGLVVRRGQPLGYFAPGGSTVVVLFQKAVSTSRPTCSSFKDGRTAPRRTPAALSATASARWPWTPATSSRSPPGRSPRNTPSAGAKRRAAVRKTLFTRRLLFVTGKGGVGKTTVASALALAGVARGLRVVLIEIGVTDNLEKLFARKIPVYELTPVEDRLSILRLDPYLALQEYLTINLKVEWAAKKILAGRRHPLSHAGGARLARAHHPRKNLEARTGKTLGTHRRAGLRSARRGRARHRPQHQFPARAAGRDRHAQIRPHPPLHAGSAQAAARPAPHAAQRRDAARGDGRQRGRGNSPRRQGSTPRAVRVRVRQHDARRAAVGRRMGDARGVARR